MTMTITKDFKIKNKDRAEYYSDKISSSDARAIASGDYHDMEKLWDNKTSQTSEDLSDVLPVQIGILTENFHADWLNKKLIKDERTGYGYQNNIEERQLHIVVESRLFTIASTLDVAYFENADVGIYTEEFELGGSKLNPWKVMKESKIVELKHTNQLTTLDKQIEIYNPQLQHHMYVSNTNEIMFSAIFGNNRHEYDIVKRDDEFLSTYMDRVEDIGKLLYQYWNAPEDLFMDGEPEGVNRDQWWKLAKELDWVSKPIEQNIVLESGKVYNLNSNADYNWANEFIESATQIKITHKSHSKITEELEHDKGKIKTLMPDDAKSVKYNGVNAIRNKKGVKSIRIEKE